MADRLEDIDVTDTRRPLSHAADTTDANARGERTHYRNEDSSYVTEESVRSLDPEVSDTDAIEIVAIRTDIEHTRQDITETLDALKEKLSPQVLLDQAKEHAREVAVEAIDNARETVQENIAATVSGVQETVGEAMHSASEAVGATVQSVTDTVGEAVEAVKERVSEAFDTAKERVGGAIESAKQTVADTAHGAQDSMGTIHSKIGGAMEGAKNTGTSLLDTAKRNPIPTALIGVGALYLVLKHQDENRSGVARRNEYDYTDFAPLDPSVSPIDPALGRESEGLAGGGSDVTDPTIETDIEAGLRAINEGPRNYGVGANSNGNGSANSNPVGTLIDLVQKNPLPAALTIFGASWLLFQSRQPDKPVRYGDYADYSHEYTSTPRPISSGSPVAGVVDSVKQTAGQVGDTVGGAVSSAKEAVGGAVNSAKDAVGGAAGTVRDKIGETAGAVRDSVGGAVDATKSRVGDAVEGAKSAVGTAKEKAVQVGGQARDQIGTLGNVAVEHSRRAGAAVADTYNDNPMAYGLVALGIGAAVGLLLPGTDPENRLLGQKRDELVGQAQSQVQDLAQKVQTVAGDTFETARSKAVEGAHAQGLA